MLELLAVLIVVSLMLYGATALLFNQIKANALIAWEWKQVKKLIKWIIGLIVKLFQYIQRSITV